MRHVEKSSASMQKIKRKRAKIKRKRAKMKRKRAKTTGGPENLRKSSRRGRRPAISSNIRRPAGGKSSQRAAEIPPAGRKPAKIKREPAKSKREPAISGAVQPPASRKTCENQAGELRKTTGGPENLRKSSRRGRRRAKSSNIRRRRAEKQANGPNPSS